MKVTRFVALGVIALAAAACGGADQRAADTTAMDTAVATAPATGTTTGPATVAPVTGTTHTVNMVGDDKGYRFEPANLTVRSGDAIKFVNVSGFPHNVAFDPATIPANAKAQLSANMPEQMTELSSKMFTTAGETYTISFGNIPAGTYPFNCTPHLAMGMKGVITVQ